MNSKDDKPDELAEHALLSATQDLMRQREDAMDAATLSRLHRIRSSAVNQTARRAWWSPLRLSAVGGGLAAAALSVVVIAPWHSEPLSSEAAVVAGLSKEDIELLATSEDLELLADLEFYLWLAQNDAQGLQG